MSKRKVIKAKWIPANWPITGIVVTYLLYKQLDLHGTAKGVFLTLAIVWWVIVCFVVLSQVFATEPSDPVFKGEL